jgi:hypothetical protein
MKNETTNKMILGISDIIINKDKLYLENKETIKNLNLQNKVILKDILNIFLVEIKELNKLNEYATFSKKAKAQIISIRLQNKLNSDFTKIIKSLFIYISSKSNLNFNDIELSISKFNYAMNLINTNKVTKFTNNKELFETIRNDKKEKELIRLTKLSK